MGKKKKNPLSYLFYLFRLKYEQTCRERKLSDVSLLNLTVGRNCKPFRQISSSDNVLILTIYC